MDTLTFTHATLIDLDEGAKPDATITLSGDRIHSVSFGPPPSPRGDAVFDLEGRSVMPGMFNCHFHASYGGFGGSTGVPVGMEASPALLALRSAANLQKALEAGFTSVISAGAPHGIDAALRAAVDEGLIRGSRMMVGSRDVSTTGHSQDLSYPWHWGPGAGPQVNRRDGADDFRRGIREEVKRGAEIIKIFLTPGHGAPSESVEMELTRDELAAAIETAHQRGAKVRAHIANKRTILTALELDIDVVDHGDGLDEECIELFLSKDAFLVPSILWPYRMGQAYDTPYARDLKAEAAAMMKILPRANQAGVKLLLGDDFGGGVVLPHGDYGDELDFYVNVVGIPPLDVLRWATRHGAELMGRGHDLGAVKPGALADLLIVEGDPTADIRVLQRKENLVAILKDGRFEKNLLGAPLRLAARVEPAPRRAARGRSTGAPVARS
jgi:imidazolonepropionase-like amidohydrolase